MVRITHPTHVNRDGCISNETISIFMNEFLEDRTRYRVNFWDLLYLYDIGRTPDGEWIGVRFLVEYDDTD
jgi:hypothetical protein